MTFLTEPWFYWILFLVALALLLAPVVGDWLERRSARRDRETWERLHPARRERS